MNSPEKQSNNAGNYKYQWTLIHYLIACIFIVIIMALFDVLGELTVLFSLQGVDQTLRQNLPYRLLLTGGLHPVVVHFPIAFIAWLSFIELMGIINKNQKNRRYRNTMFMICSVMAVFSVLFGALFMSTISFDELDKGLLQLHVGIQLISTLGILTSYYFFKKTLINSKYVRFYQATLFGSFALILVGSHFGGSMVHGTDLLTEIMADSSGYESDNVSLTATKSTITAQNASQENIADDLKDLEEKPVPKKFRNINFYKDIYPIIGKKCFRCHGPSRQKGGLRLDSPMEIYKGGESKKPILTPYHPDKSLMYVLTNLPSFDKRRMPQKGRQLTDKQKELIYYWIMQGAVWPDKK
jgi:uncharacterized membrane protein